MYSKQLYKKIYPDGSYTKYVLKCFWSNVKKYSYGWIYPTYLCIRFPFLYPRNRFNGRHYTNWKLDKKMNDIWKKWNNWAPQNIDKYVEKFGEDCTFFDRTCVKCEYVMKLAPFKDRFLYKFYDILNRFLGVFHFIPTFTELDAMPTGWRKRFGIQMCKELKQAIKKSPDKNYMKSFRIVQIKEKFGDLRFYVNLHSPEVTRVINKYEYISQYVCINCGDDAVKSTLGWISPYCEKCLPKNSRWLWIDPIYGWSDGTKEKENEKIREELP